MSDWQAGMSIAPVELGFRTVNVVPLTLPARKCALFLSTLAVATAVPALSAGSLLAATSAQQVYEQPENRNVQSDLPLIPQVAGDHQTPPDGSSTENPQGSSTENPEVAGEQPPVVPAAEPVPPGIEPAAIAPEAQPSGDTLPVTGLDVLILLGAAAAAGGVGFALRRSAAR